MLRLTKIGVALRCRVPSLERKRVRRERVVSVIRWPHSSSPTPLPSRLLRDAGFLFWLGTLVSFAKIRCRNRHTSACVGTANRQLSSCQSCDDEGTRAFLRRSNARPPFATGDSPDNKGTAAAIANALMRLRKLDANPVVGFFPSDYYFADEDAFYRPD